jgi:hypothetical protein
MEANRARCSENRTNPFLQAQSFSGSPADPAFLRWIRC